MTHNSCKNMSKSCTKCKNSIPDEEELDPKASLYPCCNKCWAEWKENRTMVMNEMRIDMTVSDQRKILKKH